MKLFYPLLIMAVCLICGSSSNAQMRQLSLDATDDMNEVQEFSFYTPSEGYVAFSRYIGFTTDSGRTFTRKYISYSNVNFNGYPANLTFGFGIKGVKAFNQDTIIVYGDYGFVPSILYSIDKGNTFTLIYHDRYDGTAFKTGITSMVFPQDHTVGYAVEADRILKTTNRGLNWFVVKLDVDRYYDHVIAIDNDNVFAFSTKYSTNKLFKTNNGGSTWTEVTVPAGQIVYTHFITAAKGWLIMQDADQNGVVYYTANGGITWEQKNDPKVTPFYSQKFHFINDNTGYALAGLFSVYKTTDSGKVWEPLPRDNSYTYLGYSHNDLQLLNSDQLWAGGGHGFIEINTNSSADPLPVAYFKADTNGIATTGTVNLRNYSKSTYQYKWFKNDTLISTSYHTSFTHNVYQFRDTIKLIVSNGTFSDSLIQYIDYPKVWITSFTPTSAAQGNVVTIDGYNFSTVFAVLFGGVSASSFTIISNTRIQATVGDGASGNVEVITTQSGTALKGGFIHLGYPKVDLPATIADSILCKSEPVTVTIQNSEPGVSYQLIPWFGFNNITGSGTGNGGTISFVTSPISESGQYRIRATRIGTSVNNIFNTYFNIRVEHTRAKFVADMVNVTPGEPVTYAAQAGEARDFLWTFYQDASITTATGAKVTGISYAGSGQKELQLISISENGCRDTTSGSAVFVYNGSAVDASCFINPMDSTGAAGMVTGQVMNSYDDGILVIGATANGTKLRSMVGVAKEFATGSHNFFAKYNASGVLKWVHYFKPGAGVFTAGQTDAQGNIYLTGYAVSNQCLYLNGDSMFFYAAPVDTTYMGARTNGFILKLDRDGKYLWHTILYDPITLWQGRAADASGDRIAIKDDHIIVIGGFYSKLSYARNGIIQQLYDLPSDVREHENHVILKIKPDGTLLWNAVMRFEATNWHRLSDVSIDKSGNSYLVGTYENYLGIYDAGGVERVKLQGQTAYHRAFMVKYDAAGAVQWHNNFVSSYQYGDAGLNKVVADDNGNTYVAGEMFNWGMPVTINITHADGTEAKDSLAAYALYKFDTNGKRIWGVGSRYPYYGGAGILYVKGNEVYAGGQIYNNGEDVGTFDLTSSDGNIKKLTINAAECFVAKYDTDGIYKRIYTSGYNYLANSIAPNSFYSNSKGQFILGGNVRLYHGGEINGMFDIAWPHKLQSTSDGFFAKMGPDFCKAVLTANAGPDKIGCAGDTVSLGSKASGDNYSWTSNPAGFISDLPNPVPKPAVNTIYYLKVTNDAGETAYDTVSVIVNPAPFANAGPDISVCANKAALIGTPAIAGNTYQWYLLSPRVSIGTAAQMNVYPSTTSSYFVRVTGPNGCPAYDTITVSTLYNGSPNVRINISKTVICKGDPVVFTAVTTNAGTPSFYQWKLRGVKVGTNSSTYTNNTLVNGDYVSVDVTHGNTCYLQPTVGTATAGLIVTDVLNPAVVVTGNTVVTEGEFTVINAGISGAGTGYQLKWQDSTGTHDWQDLPAQQTAGSYQYQPQATGDKIRCILSVSATCATANVVNSAALEFTINKVTGIDPVSADEYGIRFYPNPVEKTLTIDGLRLFDRWQQLQITGIDGRQTPIQISISNRTQVLVNAEGLRPGMYVAILRNPGGLAVYLKFIKL